mmetsp:Transcript_28109/g.45099  ORF Transcript_28109/g.45099 Transcript_28109/m.45099 type:complete len:201 (+) Transcript_28109:712-1314(+)
MRSCAGTSKTNYYCFDKRNDVLPEHFHDWCSIMRSRQSANRFYPIALLSEKRTRILPCCRNLIGISFLNQALELTNGLATHRMSNEMQLVAFIPVRSVSLAGEVATEAIVSVPLRVRFAIVNHRAFDLSVQLACPVPVTRHRPDVGFEHVNAPIDEMLLVIVPIVNWPQLLRTKPRQAVNQDHPDALRHRQQDLRCYNTT